MAHTADMAEVAHTVTITTDELRGFRGTDEQRAFLHAVQFACEDLSTAYRDAAAHINAALATGDLATLEREWPQVRWLLAPWLGSVGSDGRTHGMLDAPPPERAE